VCQALRTVEIYLMPYAMNSIYSHSTMQNCRLTKFVVVSVCLSALCATLFLADISRRLELDELSLSLKRLPKKILDFSIKRKLVLNLGGGDCQWVDGQDVDQDPNSELFSTAIVAFPGAGKRIVFLQLEALTELTTKDDFYLEPGHQMKKYAFFKTQYPHHEGIWSWGNKCSQTIYLLTEPKLALTTYLFTLHEIRYAKVWEEAYANLGRVMTIRSPIESWESWRDLRFSAEVHWWSWHIDYWMEGGLLRDMFTHEYTTAQHFSRIMAPDVYTEAELRAWQANIDITEPEYDAHCNGGDMDDCSPAAIASYERMMDPSTGPQEVAKFTAVIENKAGINFVDEEIRECAWRKIVVEKASGRRDNRDRVGPELDEYIFRPHEQEMIKGELLRIRDKYSSSEWVSNQVAQELVEYMNEYLEGYVNI